MTVVRGPDLSRPRMRAIGLATPVAIALCALIAAPASARDVDRGLRSLGDEFLAHRLAGAPHLATALGSHDQDDRLVPVTQATLEEDRAWYRDLRARIEAIPVSGLAPESARERAWLAAGVERALVELEVTRTFERDPGAYVPLVAGSVRSVMERAGASPCSRVNSAARRLAQVPEVLRAAAINLQDPPAVLVSVAIERYSGVLRFYRESVPKLAFNCRDARLQADLAQADTAAVRAVEAFLRHLREDLSAQPGGPLALGRDACQRLLDNELQESVPVESLFAEAGRAVESERARMTALLAQAPADDAADEPTGGGEAASTDHALGRVQTFLRERALVTLPGSGVTRLAVREASPDGRTVEPVTLDGPGPWELRSREAWLDVVPADSSWSAPRRLAHLARFAPGDIDLLVMREAMPGRHLRALALQGMSSRLRRALQWDWRADGWAGYCEAMVVDEGYSAEPRFAIAYERSALRNHGRALAALGLHLGSMTFEDARRMLEERCALPADDAEQEARMAASDPAAMGYTHAVFGLLELRDQARRRLGSRFRIQVFNDAVLRYGGSPIGIVREAVLRELGDGDGTSGARP